MTQPTQPIDPDASPADEQMLGQAQRAKFPDRLWECYHALRERNFTPQQSMCGAWAALGRKQRGKYTDRKHIAEILGVHVQTIAGWLSADAPLRVLVDEMRATYWHDRIADIDDAAYRDAIKDDSTAADKKLAYQRAGVLIGEDGASPDTWMQILRAARGEDLEEPNA